MRPKMICAGSHALPRSGGETHNVATTSKAWIEAFSMLADSPKLGNACDYIEPGLRKYPFQSHVIFYDLLAEDQIQVIRVLHRNMDVDQAVFSD
jgi:toxin ParE1/3/4